MTKKVAIVTGAARGIGAATATLLAEHGYAVALSYSQGKDTVQMVVDSITKQGGKAIAVQANLAIEADIIRLFDAVEQKWGVLTALVNNAARNSSGAVEEMSSEQLETIFHVNAFGAFIACREAIKRMKVRGGAIVNVSSEAARSGGNKMTYYAASKAAINTFTIGLAREVASYNIRVNAVSPGVIDTEAHQGITPERLAGLKSSLPMGRMGTSREVAEAIAWLLSDAASYVSGAILPVAGAR
jgi:NAD(P)-dependent dehydrogenase (short-subunit alcohol dehydrogenase family)